MKLKKVLATVATTVVLAGTALAQSYGTGYGMMGGGNGMGPGMMLGYPNEAYAGLDLTPDQRKTIADIQAQASKAMWQHMGAMHGQGSHMQGMFGSGPLDEAATRKSFQAMTETQQAMFELQLDARKKVDALLTKDQREKLTHHWGGR
jgi:Spy/CpxP family protein refolding chaperone